MTDLILKAIVTSEKRFGVNYAVIVIIGQV